MFRIFVSSVVAVSVLCSPVLVLAMKGPCSVTVPYESKNTIRCDGGICVGMVKITPTQRACEDTNENDCTSIKPPLVLKITYEPEKLVIRCRKWSRTPVLVLFVLFV